jgi:hypothetical protein
MVQLTSVNVGRGHQAPHLEVDVLSRRVPCDTLVERARHVDVNEVFDADIDGGGDVNRAENRDGAGRAGPRLAEVLLQVENRSSV